MTMFKKIKYIKNFGSFNKFDWDSSVRDNKDNVVVFNKVNILYGRNYSGKTTLSRIFQALEKGKLSAKRTGIILTHVTGHADNADRDSTIESTLGDLANFPGIVRVFNYDFVKENLSFLHDGDGKIKPFAVLGKDSVEDKLKIDALEKELGTTDKDMQDAKAKLENAQKELKNSEDNLENQLRDKAVDIKTTPSFEVTGYYDIRNIRDTDIPNIRSHSRALLPQQKVDEFKKVLDEPGKTTIQPPEKLDLQLAHLARDAKEFVERETNIGKPISEIASTPEFRGWIQQGLKLHRAENLTSCGFCGWELPGNLLADLEVSFNDDVENLTSDIDDLLKKAKGEQTMVRKYGEKYEFDSGLYVESVKENQRDALKQFKIEAQQYSKDVQSLVDQLVQRKDDILNPKEFNGDGADFSNLVSAESMLHSAIQETNEVVANLSEKKKEAREELRLNEVQKYMKNIDYERQTAEIARRNLLSTNAQVDYDKKLDQVVKLTNEIDSLKAKLADKKTGAETVNAFLRFCFGHELLSLHAVKEGDGNPDNYQFVIRRNNGDADNLSDGERNIIAFCYFMASLSDNTVEAPKDKLIVWIDDPVSSLDDNHIFSVYSLIYSKIMGDDEFKQLFVSTHNLELLKYLSNNSSQCSFFHIERQTQTSTISVMPEYLRKCATEFNHLFLQIRKCAEANEINDQNRDDFVTFSNNARRFLELFLYYLYPNTIEHRDRMLKFFKDEDSATRILVDKVLNEFSHFQKGFGRGLRPLDVNKYEVQKVAKVILGKIKKLNQTQFCELMASTNDNNAQN